jgi:hypothetical protein
MKNAPYKKYYLAAKIVLTAIIFFALYRNAQLNFTLFYPFLNAPFSALGILTLCLLMVFLNSWRWYRLNAAQGIPLSFSRTITPAYLGIAFNNVLPGNVGGDFFRLYFVMKKFPDQKSKAILSIFVDRVVGLMGVLVMACLTTPFYLDTVRHNPVLFYLIVACFSFCAICLVGFFAVTILLSEKMNLTDRLKKTMNKSRFAKPLIALLDAIHVYRNSKWIILECLITAMTIQLITLFIVVMISNMMGLPPLAASIYMLALAIGQIANLAPLTPGGIGVGEAAFANIIYLLNPSAVAPYATVFLALRLFNTVAYLPGVVLGIVGFNALNKSNAPVAQ